MAVHRQKPLTLVVFLENVGHIGSLPLPSWVKSVVDYATEEYAKLLLHLYGAHRRYDQVILLEDALATGDALAATLLFQQPDSHGRCTASRPWLHG